MSRTFSEGRSASRIAALLLGVCVLCLLGWAGSWFISPRPAWAHDLPFLGIVCAAFAGILRRSAARAVRQPGSETG
jgi:hypothetical protein